MLEILFYSVCLVLIVFSVYAIVKFRSNYKRVQQLLAINLDLQHQVEKLRRENQALKADNETQARIILDLRTGTNAPQ